MSNIGVLGAGTWGMALARMLCLNNNSVTVWSAIGEEIDNLNKTRVHPNLKEMIIPEKLVFTKSIKDACVGKDLIVFAVPSVFVRETAKKAAEFINDTQIIADVAKGIENGTLFTMSEVISDELKRNNPDAVCQVAALSGPTHAEEVARDLPTVIVSASHDIKIAESIQDIFTSESMRVYTNTDVKGVELCGALKNIMALASGISSGLGYGDNAKAALITRGIHEITKLGIAMGCSIQTFAGLAGIGDLIVTATSVHSRNNRAGYLIGRGFTPQDAIKEVGMVVEGINAIPAALTLADKYHVDMPLLFAVNNVINNGADPRETVSALMHRDKKTESY